MVRDQLTESINAAIELQKGGKTVRAAEESKPAGDPRILEKKAVERGHAEVVAATVAVAVAMGT